MNKVKVDSYRRVKDGNGRFGTLRGLGAKDFEKIF